MNYEYKSDNVYRTLKIAGFFFFFIAIMAVIAVITSYKFTNGEIQPNLIGDFLGGVLNPFFTLCAVCVTALAFYAQYQANKLIQDEANVRVFESQFYEMMRVHQTNIDRLRMSGMIFRNTESNTTKIHGELKEVEYLSNTKDRFYFDILGTNVFKEIKNELELLIELYIWYYGINFNEDDFVDACYNILFNGLTNYSKDKNYKGLSSFIQSLFIIRNAYLIGKDRVEIWKYRNDSYEKLRENNYFKVMPKSHMISKTIFMNDQQLQHLPFEGCGYIIGNHFRQLFHCVKFVVDNSVIEKYDSKLKYLNMLRAQMSYEEVVILFYNWLGFAPQWEDDTNSFFIDYRMIHNLWHTRLHKNSYSRKKLFELLNKKGTLNNKPIFEIPLSEDWQ